jgi:hypothetical protein
VADLATHLSLLLSPCNMLRYSFMYTSLLSGLTSCSRLILCLLSPRVGTSHFSEWSWSPFVGKSRDHNVGTMCTARASLLLGAFSGQT